MNITYIQISPNKDLIEGFPQNEYKVYKHSILSHLCVEFTFVFKKNDKLGAPKSTWALICRKRNHKKCGRAVNFFIQPYSRYKKPLFTPNLKKPVHFISLVKGQHLILGCEGVF